MRRSLVTVAMLVGVLVVGVGGAALAEIVPNYIPCECYLSPAEQYITRSAPQAQFTGEWYEGQTGTYQVYISYGDGYAESFSTSSHIDSFFHHYSTSGKPAGYRWTVTLRVTNGNTDYSYATVILKD